MTLPLRLIRAAGFILLVTLAGLAGFGTGCQGQGEGERCTWFMASGLDAGDFNGNSECQSGLVCKQAFNTTLYPFDRCCPVNEQDPNNVPACYAPGTMGGADAATEGSTMDGPTDAPGDASTDGSMKDAPAKDAPAKDAPPGESSSSDAPGEAKPAPEGSAG